MPFITLFLRKVQKYVQGKTECLNLNKYYHHLPLTIKNCLKFRDEICLS